MAAKKAEPVKPQIRTWDSPGYGPTVYLDEDRGRVVNEVDALERAAGVLANHLHDQWDDAGPDVVDLEMIGTAFLDVVLMWKARVPWGGDPG